MDTKFDDWYEVLKINENMYLINEQDMATMYLILGTKKALLIDTAMGFGDLYGLVRRITDLPILLINTHGHPDHIWGNDQFEEAYLSKRDEKLYRSFYDNGFKETKGAEILSRHNMILPQDKLHSWVSKNSCELKFIDDYSVIDIGGRMLQVIPLAGHTAGSIMLYDEEEHLLFSGDAINHHLWMHLKESMPLETYLEGIKKVKETLPEIKTIYYGHCREAQGSPASLIDHVIKDVSDVLEGRVKGKPYHDQNGDSLLCNFEVWNLWYPVNE